MLNRSEKATWKQEYGLFRIDIFEFFHWKT
jgi:hypothetical protein